MSITILSSIIGFFLGLTLLPLSSRFLKAYSWEKGLSLTKLVHFPRFPKAKTAQRTQELKELWGAFSLCSFIYGIIFAIIFYILFLYAPFWNAVFLAAMLFTIALAGLIDLKSWLLFDFFTIPLIVSGFAVSYYLSPIASIDESIFGAIYAYIMPVIVASMMQKYHTSPLGGGDVKALTAMGAWLGFELFNIMLIVSFVFFVLLAWLRKSKVAPYGPALAISVILCTIVKVLYGN